MVDCETIKENGKFNATGGRPLRYEWLHAFNIQSARLAQLVEHQTFNLRVAGSSPSSGACVFHGEVA